MTPVSTTNSLFPLRIGARGSTLARTQAHYVQKKLAEMFKIDSHDIDKFLPICTIKTSGDKIPGPLADKGGKGLFVKELQIALQENAIDLAIHSAKDHPTVKVDGLTTIACTKRDDPRDAVLISNLQKRVDQNFPLDIAQYPTGFTFGTASPRRRAQILSTNPGINIKLCRGNVQTRIRKLHDGEFDGLILAAAGLRRMNLTDQISQYIETHRFVPCAGQGSLLIEIRQSQFDEFAFLAQLNHRKSWLEVFAERAFISALGGSCETPIGVFASIDANKLSLISRGYAEDGKDCIEISDSLSLTADLTKMMIDMKNQNISFSADHEQLPQNILKFASALGEEMRRKAGHFLKLEQP